MTILRKLFTLAALLPGFAGAADQAMLDLIMPDARLVAHIHLARILASPIGQTMKAEIDKAQPQWQQQLTSAAGFDLTQYVQEILIASTGGTAKDAPTLVIVRGSLDPSQIEPLKALKGSMTEYEGVPLLLSAGKDEGAIAFLDGGLAVLGRPADVKAAVHRRGHGADPPAIVAQKMNQFEGRYDLWVVAEGPFPTLPSQAQAAAVKPNFLEHIDAFQGGVRFSPDFELSAEVEMRTDKDAAGMADGVRWLQGIIQSVQKNSKRNNLQFDVKGRRILFSVRASEEEVRAALLQRRAPVAPRQVAAAQPAPNASTSVVPPPPPGTIRVTSSPSDMGVVLVPNGKGQ